MPDPVTLEHDWASVRRRLDLEGSIEGVFSSRGSEVIGEHIVIKRSPEYHSGVSVPGPSHAIHRRWQTQTLNRRDRNGASRAARTVGVAAAALSGVWQPCAQDTSGNSSEGGGADTPDHPLAVTAPVVTGCATHESRDSGAVRPRGPGRGSPGKGVGRRLSATAHDATGNGVYLRCRPHLRLRRSIRWHDRARLRSADRPVPGMANRQDSSLPGGGMA